MRPLLALSLALIALPAFANPMLDKCLPFAPPVCGLNDQSPADQFLACFETARLDAKKPAEAACAEELAHARVHKECDADIAKVCSKVKPGENRTMSCLRKNAKTLAPACGKALKAYNAILLNADPVDESKGGSKKRRSGAGVSAVRC